MHTHETSITDAMYHTQCKQPLMDAMRHTQRNNRHT